jgi:hypothetical protein
MHSLILFIVWKLFLVFTLYVSVYFLVFILFSFVASLLIGVLLVVSISLLASQKK